MFNNITPEVALRILKEVMGPPRRELTGEEYKETYLLIQFLDPAYVSNNQNSITEVYRRSDKEYHVHYFTLDSDPIIEEVLDEQ